MGELNDLYDLTEEDYVSRFFLEEIYCSPFGFERQNLHSTISKRNYFRALRHICNFCKKDFLELTRSDASKYVKALQEGKLRAQNGNPFKKTSIDVRLTCLRSIGNWLMDEKENSGLPGALPIPSSYESPFEDIVMDDTPDIAPDHIPSVGEIEKIYLAADPQLRVILCLVVRCSLTSSEIMKLRCGDFHFTEETDELRVHIEDARIKKSRDILVPDDIRPLVLDYLSGLSGSSMDHVFLNRAGKPYVNSILFRRVQKCVHAAGCSQDWNLMDLRNASVCHMLYNEAKPEDVADYLGVLPKWIKRYEKAVKEMDLTATPNKTSVIQIRTR